jgi:hypothetical protein
VLHGSPGLLRRLDGIIAYPSQRQQEEKPEKSPPFPFLPSFRIGRRNDQRTVFIQVGSQFIPIGTIRPERVLVRCPLKEIVYIIAFYV